MIRRRFFPGGCDDADDFGPGQTASQRSSGKEEDCDELWEQQAHSVRGDGGVRLRVLARGPTLTLDLLVKTWKARPVVQAQRVG